MTHLITFAIPTWKRPERLERCVKSIAEQVRDGRTQILISEDVDDQETTDLIKRLQGEYGFIRKVEHTPRTDYADNFKTLFSNTDGEWTWMFGDDDYLRPGALDFMLEHLPKQELEFIHVSEETRASGNNGYGKGTLWTLANNFGWVEMTGFITGNIVRSQSLLEAMQTKWWRFYAKTAFVQSCILLEQLKDSPCAFLDLPLIGSQDPGQTEETGKRWMDANISGRYLYMADALELMYEEGILKNRVKKEFFRYLNFHLWNRYIVFFVNDYLNQGILVQDELWSKIQKLATFLEDIEEAKQIIGECEAARGMITLHSYMQRNAEGIRMELQNVLGRQNQDVYPFTYIKPVDE